MQRWSKLFIPTLREAPADATSASHIYLLRSGYARRESDRLFSYLTLGARVCNKVRKLIRDDMNGLGQEVSFPAGAWALKEDGWGRRLGNSFYATAGNIAGHEIRSYKQLPQVWYQFWRKDTKPSGRLRPEDSGAPERLVWEGCSFESAAESTPTFDSLVARLHAILQHCDLAFSEIEMPAQTSGQKASSLVWFHDSGGIRVLACESCGKKMHTGVASSRILEATDLAGKGNGLPLEIHTPGQRTIDDVSRFLGIDKVSTAKTLTYWRYEFDEVIDDSVERPVVALLRGDHMVEEGKLAAAIGPHRPMEPAEAQALFGAPFGSLGPVGIPTDAKPLVLVDTALRGHRNLVTGANREDYHFWNVTPERDFVVDRWVDLRVVEAGEPCPKCGAPLQEQKATRLASAAVVDSTLTVLDKNGKDSPVYQASYSIDLESILAAAIEQHHDDQGFWLSASIAPFTVVICVMSVRDEALMQTAVQIANTLESAGHEVLLDDRDERPGVKFKDADLSGIPFRVTVGKKVSEGKVEVYHRSTRTTHDASIAAIRESLELA